MTKATTLPYTLTSASLDWALASVKRFSDTDIFPRPFEFDAIEEDWGRVRPYLEAQDLDTWTARAQRVCLSPKGLYSYRIATQLDPLDTLTYLALVFQIGEALEASRLPVGSRSVLSHRFAPDATGQLYAPNSWTDFQTRSKELADDVGVHFVVETDISDFYHRIYHHRLENAIAAASSPADARVVNKLVSQWAGTPSYSIPVGPAPSRLLAEIAIGDVDRYLIAKGAVFCRYVDDYRIFCATRTEAYDLLATLAGTLFENHGLTLQPGKTIIRSSQSFTEQLTAFESTELAHLKERFADFRALVGIGGYDDIEYDDLDENAKDLIDELNLEDLLRGQLQDSADAGLMRFILRRLTQLDDPDPANLIVENLEHLYTVLADVVRYLAALTDARLDAAHRATIGATISALAKSSTVGHLSYHRSWLLSLFAESASWGQADQLVPLYEASTDSFARRELMLAIGRAKFDFWLRARRNTFLALDPWERRAFLLAVSCWPKDERDYWYRDMAAHFDVLERAVVAYARAHPLA